MLDEYVDSKEYHDFIFENLINKLPEDNLPQVVHVLYGYASDWDTESARYEDLIRAENGFDLVIAGMGVEGHIGGNESGSAFHSRTRAVEMVESTRRVNKTEHTHWLTVGLGTILEVGKIIIINNGAAKARAIGRIFHEDPSTDLPVSVLRLHNNAMMIMDKAAAAEIPPEFLNGSLSIVQQLKLSLFDAIRILNLNSPKLLRASLSMALAFFLLKGLTPTDRVLFGALPFIAATIYFAVTTLRSVPETRLSKALVKDTNDWRTKGEIETQNRTARQIEKLLPETTSNNVDNIDPAFVRLTEALRKKKLDAQKLSSTFAALIKKKFGEIPVNLAGWVQAVLVSEIFPMKWRQTVENKNPEVKGSVVVVDEQLAKNTSELRKLLARLVAQYGRQAVLVIPASETAEEILRRNVVYFSANILPHKLSAPAFREDEEGFTLDLKNLDALIESFLMLQTSEAISMYVPQDLTVNPLGLSRGSRLRSSIFFFINATLTARMIDFKRLVILAELVRLIVKQA